MEFRSYEEANADAGALEPIRVWSKNEAEWDKLSKEEKEHRTFVLPSPPPASFGFLLTNILVMTEGKFSPSDGMIVLPKVMSEEDITRLSDLVSDKGVFEFTQDVLKAYGWEFGTESPVPNQEALQESTSQPKPSDVSEPSRLTGSATTASVS